MKVWAVFEYTMLDGRMGRTVCTLKDWESGPTPKTARNVKFIEAQTREDAFDLYMIGLD